MFSHVNNLFLSGLLPEARATSASKSIEVGFPLYTDHVWGHEVIAALAEVN
jgi:hypothetical protein